MRYLVSLACALAFVFAPVGVSAQAGEDEGGSRLERWHPGAFVDPSKPASEPASEESALQLEVTPAGVDVVPTTARWVEEQTLEEMKRRVRLAGVGTGISVIGLIGGAAMVGAAASNANVVCLFECPPPPSWVAPVGGAGVALMVGGLVGMTVLHLIPQNSVQPSSLTG